MQDFSLLCRALAIAKSLRTKEVSSLADQGAETRSLCCGAFVLVDEAAEQVATVDVERACSGVFSPTAEPVRESGGLRSSARCGRCRL